jgi:hypothetical protein
MLRNNRFGPGQPLAFQTFIFNTEGDEIAAVDVSGRYIPRYAVKRSRLSGRDIAVTRLSSGLGPSAGQIGAIRIHSLSSKMDITVQGHNTVMDRDRWSSSGAYHVFWPPVGQLVWDTNGAYGSEMFLSDESGRTLARFVPSQGSNDNRSARIEILVPGDEMFVDLVIVTAIAKSTQRSDEQTATAASQGASNMVYWSAIRQAN